MTIELYFLRHGLAGQHGDPKFKDDSLRPLTAEGQQKMRGSTIGMQKLGISFDAILSSPYLRAKQTAKIVAQGYKIKKIHLTKNLLPPASIQELLKEALHHFPRSKKFLFVGHEPHLTEMISSLLESGKPLPIDLKKGGLCCLKVLSDPKRPSAALCWLLTSQQLNALDPDL